MHYNPCWLSGSDDLLDTCKKFLNIEVGQTTNDGMFTLKEVECLGACVNAPMVQINDDYYEDLNNESLLKLLNDLKNDKKVKIGTQVKGRLGENHLKIWRENRMLSKKDKIFKNIYGFSGFGLDGQKVWEIGLKLKILLLKVKIGY